MPRYRERGCDDAIVAALQANPGASVRELALAPGAPASFSTVLVHLKRLVAEGRVIEVRPTGTRRWRVAGSLPVISHPVIQAAIDWRRAITELNGVHAAEQALLAALADVDQETQRRARGRAGTAGGKGRQRRSGGAA